MDQTLIESKFAANDPFQSVSFSKGLASSVANDPGMTGKQSGDVYLDEMIVPDLDLINPEDYVSKGRRPTSYELTDKEGKKHLSQQNKQRTSFLVVYTQVQLSLMEK